MKMKFLALSVALALGGVAGSANAAFEVTQDGVGHVLVVPYFTTQAGQHTFLNIVNTDSVNAKAVKVRFRGALDSDDVFDFQVFLSPNDVWVADVQPTPDGKGTALYTSDNSCTLPKNVGKDWTQDANGAWVPGANSVFVTGRLKKDDPVGVKEGYVEIFNMADIPPKLNAVDGGGRTTEGTGAGSGADNPLWTAVKHVNVNGVQVAPCTGDTNSASGVLGAIEINNHDSFSIANQSTLQLDPPSGTLFGNWVILNTADNSAYSSWATTLRAENATRLVYSAQTVATVKAYENLLEFGSGSGTALATLATVSPPAGTADYGIRSTADAVLLNQAETGVKTAKYDFPDLSTPYEVAYSPVFGGATAAWPTDAADAQARALSNAILRSTTTGEFLSDVVGGVVLATDWVFSQPTRRYHVAGRGGVYAFGSNATKTLSTLPFTNGAGPTAPYSKNFVTYAADGHGAAVEVGGYSYYDRSELAVAGTSDEIVISPSTPATAAKLFLANEVGVVSLNNGAGAASGVLKSPVTTLDIGGVAKAGSVDVTFPAGFTKTGWATLNLKAAGNTFGLPLLGQQFSKYVAGANAAAAGYGTNYDHRFTGGTPVDASTSFLTYDAGLIAP